jgi:hypothetical protein
MVLSRLANFAKMVNQGRRYRSTASFAYVRFLPRHAVPDADPEADAAADGGDAAAEPEAEPVSIFGAFTNKAALASGANSDEGSEEARQRNNQE